uniref:LIM zinc-binding domain-containing protein n=1 Tax=Coturnix japonica TaxID=93934 RepID=A0A8C2TIH4_COTJA
MLKEVCASCLQPVYSMERVFPDRVCLHHSCFCCKICGKKLSLHSYAALHGVFYCQVHYKQMAGAKSRREREGLEQQPGDDQMQPAAMVGKRTQPLDWYSGTENKTKARREPTSFSAPCSLQLAERRQELNSRPATRGNKLKNCWPPSETDGKAGKGMCLRKKSALSWQNHQAAGNKVDRMVLMGQERKTATEAALREGSFPPGVTYPEKREQVCSRPKPREERDGGKALAPGNGDVGNGKRGGQVSQRVAAFQQGKLQLKTGSASHMPESLETRNNMNMKQKNRDEGNKPPEPKAKHQAPLIPVVPGTPSAAPSSSEPEGLSASPEIAELVSETSKINADELPREQTAVLLEENMQPSSISHLPGEESTAAEFEKTNRMEEVNPPGFLEELSTEHTSLKRPSATQPSHDEVNNSKSRDPSEDLLGNIFPISEQPIEKLESSKSTVSSDKYRGHPQGKEKMKLKHSEGTVVDTLRPSDKGKETRSSQARTDALGKGFTFGKKPFTAVFGSEDKSSTHKKETTQGKPTEPQSALVTLSGCSSEKQSQQKYSAESSEQINNEDKQEEPQDLLTSSSQAKQKASKNDQPPQPEKTVVITEDTQDSAGGCSDTTEDKETNALFSAPGTNFSGDDKQQRTELSVHDQQAVGRQVQQPQERCCPSLLPAQENQTEGAISFEGGRNPFYPPPDLMSAVDYSKNNLTGDGNPRVGHLLDQNLELSLDVQNRIIEDEIFNLSSSVGKLPKEAELQVDKMDLLENDNIFLSVENKRQDLPTVETPALDLQNPQTGTPPCFDPNPSNLDQEILAETWDTSSLLFLAGQDVIVTRDTEGSQGCAPLQHFDPQYQAPRASEGAFGLGPRAEGPTNKYLPMQEGSTPAWYLFTSHAADNSHQNLFDPLNDVSDQTGQDAPAKMERSREISEVEEAHENLPSADPNVFDDGLLKQEFFI